MRFRHFILALGLIALAGCSSGSMQASTKGDGTEPPRSFSQLTDVPIPEGAHMDLDRTLMVGPTQSWLGRLVFSVRWTSPSALYDFYRAQMPVFGWQEIAAVRTGTSVMTWQRNDRIATIQISDTMLGGEVQMTITPVNGAAASGTGGGSDQGASPPPPAPAPAEEPVTTQPLK